MTTGDCSVANDEVALVIASNDRHAFPLERWPGRVRALSISK